MRNRWNGGKSGGGETIPQFQLDNDDLGGVVGGGERNVFRVRRASCTGLGSEAWEREESRISLDVLFEQVRRWCGALWQDGKHWQRRVSAG